MKRKLMSLFLALAMLCSLFVPALAADETPVTPYSVPTDISGKLVIIHTNDTHGRDVAAEGKTVGTAGVVALKKEFEAAGAKVLLLSAGDFSQGTTLVGLDQGASAVDFMNAAGYDVAALGNHEFDFKMDALRANVEKAEFPILGSNVVDAATKKPLFGDRVTFDTPAGKVGIFGVVTPETMTKAHPDNVKGLTMYQGEAMYADAQAQVNALKADGCKYIIALGHLGVSEESEPNRSTDLLAKVTGIDLFIDGHSHTEIPGGQKVGNTLLVSTGEYLNNVGVVIVDGESTSARLISAAEYTKVDAEVNALINARAEAVKEEMSKTFGSTEVFLNGARDPGNRTEETNLGNFAADAILWSARGNVGEDKVDAALTNGGGIRESIKIGEITMNDMKTVFPFGNEVITIDVTGAQLLEALEAATWSTPTAIGAFPQVSGIKFSIDTSVAYEKGEMYPDSTYYAPKNPGARVTIENVNGKAFDAGATYTIATNDFTAAGGDTYYVFKAGTNRTMTSVPLEDALINYTKEVMNGVITAEKYGKTEGRITIKYVGVVPGAWYVEAARYVMDEGIMTGTGKAGFDPSGTVTRATVFQTLYNMAGAPQNLSAASFTDVSGKWYAKAAAWAESVGLAAVPANKLFNGERSITRAEIATILIRHAELTGLQSPDIGTAMKSAPDYASIPAWALDGMTWSYYAKVITGRSGGLLDPSGNALRTELAQILLNLSKVPGAYTEQEVAIEVPARDGVPAHTVAGVLTMPASAGKDAKVPGIVMLHGTGSNKDEAGGGYAMAAPIMAEAGLATLRIDFMGTAPDKAADYKHYSYTSANIDAKAAADYLAKLEGVDASKLGVMGWSQGGTNALLAAAKYPDTFKSVVTWAGALDLKGLAGEDFDKAYDAARKDGSYPLVLEWRDPSQLPMGAKWFEDVKNTDLLTEVGKIKAPILAINGASDVVVTPDNAEKIAAAAKNVRSYELIVENCDHTFNVFSGDYSAILSAISSTADYFTDTLTADYMEVPVTVMNGKRAVPAVVTIPAGSGPFASVVMNHGHGGSKDEGGGFGGVAAALAREGIMSIRMDFPGCGESAEPFTENYMSNMISDSNACKDYLLANFPVDKNNLGILGYSMGGRITATIIGEKDTPYKAAVLLAGAVGDGQALAYGIVGGEANYEKAYNTAKTEGKYTITTQYGQVQDLSQKWFDDMVASKPLAGASGFTGPVLVIYGDKDNVVPPAVNKLSFDAYGNSYEIIVEGADHGYGFYSDQPGVTEAVEGGISSFFAESLGQRTMDKAA